MSSARASRAHRVIHAEAHWALISLKDVPTSSMRGIQITSPFFQYTAGLTGIAAMTTLGTAGIPHPTIRFLWQLQGGVSRS